MAWDDEGFGGGFSDTSGIDDVLRDQQEDDQRRSQQSVDDWMQGVGGFIGGIGELLQPQQPPEPTPQDLQMVQQTVSGLQAYGNAFPEIEQQEADTLPLGIAAAGFIPQTAQGLVPPESRWMGEGVGPTQPPPGMFGQLGESLGGIHLPSGPSEFAHNLLHGSEHTPSIEQNIQAAGMIGDLPAYGLRQVPGEQSLPSQVRGPLEMTADFLPFVLGGEGSAGTKLAGTALAGAGQYYGTEAGHALNIPDIPLVGNPLGLIGGLAAPIGGFKLHEEIANQGGYGALARQLATDESGAARYTGGLSADDLAAYQKEMLTAQGYSPDEIAAFGQSMGREPMPQPGPEAARTAYGEGLERTADPGQATRDARLAAAQANQVERDFARTGADERAGTVTMYHGNAGPIEGGQLREGAFLTPNPEDAQVFANIEAKLNGGEPTIHEVQVQPGSLIPAEEGLAGSRGAMQVAKPEGVRLAEPAGPAPEGTLMLPPGQEGWVQRPGGDFEWNGKQAGEWSGPSEKALERNPETGGWQTPVGDVNSFSPPLGRNPEPGPFGRSMEAEPSEPNGGPINSKPSDPTVVSFENKMNDSLVDAYDRNQGMARTNGNINKSDATSVVNYMLRKQDEGLQSYKPGPNAIERIKGAVGGTTGDTFITNQAFDRDRLIAGLVKNGMDTDLAKQIGNSYLDRGVWQRYGGNVPENVAGQLHSLREAPNEILDAAKTLSERTKAGVFGLSDIGVFGQQLLAGVRYGGVQAGLGQIVDAATMLLEKTTGKNPLYAKGLDRTTQNILDGAWHSGERGGVTKGSGTVLSYIPGPGKWVDQKIVGPFADKLNEIQFGNIMGTYRDRVFEWNLMQAKLLGKDIEAPNVRGQAMTNANTVVSQSRSALMGNRRAAESTLLLSPSITRAQIERLNEVSRLVRTGSSVEQRAQAAMMVLSYAGFTLGVGKILNDAVGKYPFQFDPTAKFGSSFGRITIEGKGNQKDTVINVFPQRSFEKAITDSIQALKQEDSHKLATAWAKLASGRESIPVGIVARNVGKTGYDQEGKFYLGDFPHRSTEEAIKQELVGNAPSTAQSLITNQVSGPLGIGSTVLGANTFESDPTTGKGFKAFAETHPGAELKDYRAYRDEQLAQRMTKTGLSEKELGKAQEQLTPYWEWRDKADANVWKLAQQTVPAFRSYESADAFQKEIRDNVVKLGGSPEQVKVPRELAQYFQVIGQAHKSYLADHPDYLDLLQRAGYAVPK